MKLPGFLILSFICLMIFAKSTAQEEPRIVCYYDRNSRYRPADIQLLPENINPDLCTHLIYTWGKLSLKNDSLLVVGYDDIQLEGYAKFNDLRTSNKNLKTFLSIGGSNRISREFSLLVGDADRRRTFARNAIIFLRQYHFDGLDFNLRNPTDEAYGIPPDRKNYVQFVQELREECDRESSKTKESRLLLTIGIPPSIDEIKQGYDVVKLNQYIDWFNVLSYDYYHDSYEPTTNHLAPLYSLKENDELNVNSSVQFLIAAGVDRQKLVLGIPTYGRSFKLFKLDATGIGAPANGPGNLGYYRYGKAGCLPYYEICNYIKSDDEWTVVHPNDTVMGPYLYKDDQWISYDDEIIARKKAQYAANNGLGGLVFSAIEMDDPSGLCSGNLYPIINAAKTGLYDALRNKSPDSRENKVATTPQNNPTQTTTVSNEAVTSLRPDSTQYRKNTSEENTSVVTENDDPQNTTPAQYRKNTTSEPVYLVRMPPTNLKINSDGSQEQNNFEESTSVVTENDDPQNTTPTQYRKNTTSEPVYLVRMPPTNLKINSDGSQDQNNSEEGTLVVTENDDPQNTTPTQYRKNTTSEPVYLVRMPPTNLKINSDGSEEQNNPEESTSVVTENDDPQNTTPTQYRKNTTSESVYLVRMPPTNLKINSNGSEGQNNSEENTSVVTENDDPQNTTPTQYRKNTTSEPVYLVRMPPTNLKINSDGSEDQNNSEESTILVTENDDPQNTTPTQYRKNTTSEPVYLVRMPPTNLKINSDGSQDQNNSEEGTLVVTENDDPQNTTPTQYRKNTTSEPVYLVRRPPTNLKINSNGSQEQNNFEESTSVVTENDDPQNTTPTQYRKNTTSEPVYLVRMPPTNLKINSDGSEEQNNPEESTSVVTENDDPQNTTPTQYRKNTTSEPVYLVRMPPTNLKINSNGSEGQNNSEENTSVVTENNDPQNTTPTQYRKNTTSEPVYLVRMPPTNLKINSDGSEEQNNPEESTSVVTENDDPQNTTPTQYRKNTTSEPVYLVRMPPTNLKINSDGSQDQNNSAEGTLVVTENDDPQNTTPTQYRKNTTSEPVYLVRMPPTNLKINSNGSEGQNNSEENTSVVTENDDPQNTTPTQYRKNTTSEPVYLVRRPPTNLKINLYGFQEQNNSEESTIVGARNENDDFQGKSGSSKPNRKEVESSNSPDASSSIRIAIPTAFWVSFFSIIFNLKVGSETLFKLLLNWCLS